MHLPCVFHGEMGGTKELYGPSRGIESLSGSPSTVTIWRRSLCGRRGWRAGDVGGVRSLGTPVGSGGGEKRAYLVVRVGACANKLRLMGVERGSSTTGVAGAVMDSASFAMKASSACAPPAIERMWIGPYEEVANCIVKSVAKGGRRGARRCALSRRFAVTKDCSE